MKVIKAPVVFENAAGKRVAEITEEGDYKVLGDLIGYATDITEKRDKTFNEPVWFIIAISMILGASIGIAAFNIFFV